MVDTIVQDPWYIECIPKYIYRELGYGYYSIRTKVLQGFLINSSSDECPLAMAVPLRSSFMPGCHAGDTSIC